jgi:DNA-binding transcriptional MocR family regulator
MASGEAPSSKGQRETRPAGGFLLWLELPRPLKSRALIEEVLSHGVCFAPGDAFSASDRDAHGLHLSCGHGWQTAYQSARAVLVGPRRAGQRRRRRCES